MLRFATLFWRVLSSRAARVLLYVWMLGWGFDRAIYWATEAAWFGSVEQGAWFTTRFLAQFGLFWGTLLGALISATPLMRLAARPLPDAETKTLPRALERLEPLRRAAMRLAWVFIVVSAWIVARHVAGGWPLMLAGARGSLLDPIWGLPLARLITGALWQWTLCLLGATAFAGVLRVLPLLATREPLAPLRLWRALSVLGALALLLRGALYLLESGEALASDGISGRELWLGLPLAIGGAALCLVAAWACLRRPGFKRLGVAVALALMLPRVLSVVSAPLGLIVPVPKAVAARELAATRAGWNLDDAPALDASAPPLASHWPIWDEEALVGLARGQRARHGAQVIDWRAAFLLGTTGLVAGVPATLDNWGARHEAQPENALDWLAFDATAQTDGVAPELPDAPLPLRSFYGVEGRPLLGEAPLDAGVPFAFWGWKAAWAWRLRDPLLMLEGARASRLLVFRGARESAEMLAPFLNWDAPQLVATPDGWRWQLIGYATSQYFHGARAATRESFEGNNAVAPAVRLQIDPGNGRAEFFSVDDKSWSDVWARIVAARRDGETNRLAMPQLQAARAQVARDLDAGAALSEPVWTRAGGRIGRAWRAPNLPAGVEEKLSQLDAVARRDWSDEGAELRNGGALLWPDARAPGGFWVGRPYYRTAPVAGGVAREARLWRVGLTGLADSPLVTGDDARAALLAFDLKNVAAPSALAPISSQMASKNAPVLEALRAHDAAQKAAKASNWEEWAKQSARERQLLEGLAARAVK